LLPAIIKIGKFFQALVSININLIKKLEKISTLVRYYILMSTSEAGSGHPTSSLSAVELMVTLLFGRIFKYRVEEPDFPNNDRLIFSKGHASPLLYSLWAAAGALDENKLLSLRKFDSNLEGHPTPSFPYAGAATGSLGQGLSIGLGMAINAKYIDKLSYRTYVLLGDSEMTEGSIWEAIQIASHYKLDNITAILDVNRLGQRGETIYGHDIMAYKRRISSFGWNTILVDGHNIEEILMAYCKVSKIKGRPAMIIAKTIKGKGVSFLEDKEGWHGQAIKKDRINEAINQLGDIDKSIKAGIEEPEYIKRNTPALLKPRKVIYSEKEVSTRRAYGNALVYIYSKYPDMVVLDGEVSNSTYSQIFKQNYPDRFFEMYIAEQNMVGIALGLSLTGKLPFVSTFGAFLTRAFDQIRMSQYSRADIKFCGSHAGVSIGEDGPSQMGLEDIAMFRTILDSIILYPADAVSTEKLVELAAGRNGIAYIRTTRMDTPIIYCTDEKFRIGGNKVLKKSDNDIISVCAAGITLHEALAAYDRLLEDGIFIRVIDLYCLKPIDRESLLQATDSTRAILTVEDHFAEGGMGEAVRSTLYESKIPVFSLSVTKMPKSGRPKELLDYEGISRDGIVREVKKIVDHHL
jgi:transketolase